MCCQIRLNFTYSSSRIWISAVFPILSQSKQTISKSNHIIMLKNFSVHIHFDKVEGSTFSCLTRDYWPCLSSMKILKITILKVTSFKLWIFFVVYLIRFLWYTKYQVHSILTIGEVAMCVMCCSITFNNSTNSPKNSKVEGDYPHLAAAAPLCVVWLPDFALKSPIQPWLPDNWKWKRQFSLLGWPWLYTFSVVDVMTWEHLHVHLDQ